MKHKTPKFAVSVLLSLAMMGSMLVPLAAGEPAPQPQPEVAPVALAEGLPALPEETPDTQPPAEQSAPAPAEQEQEPAPAPEAPAADEADPAPPAEETPAQPDTDAPAPAAPEAAPEAVQPPAEPEPVAPATTPDAAPEALPEEPPMVGAQSVGTFTVAGYSGTYDGQPHGVTVNNPSGLSLVYSSNALGPFSFDPVTRTDAGTTTVWVRVAGDESTTRQADITIEKASATIQLNYLGENGRSYLNPAYTGEVDIQPQPRVTGEVNGEKLAYTLTVPPVQFSGNVPEKALPMLRTATLSFADNDGVNKNYNIKLLDYLGNPISAKRTTATISITQRDLGIQPANVDLVYGESLAEPVRGSIKMTGLIEQDRDYVSVKYIDREAYRWWFNESGQRVLTSQGVVPVDALVPGAKLDVGYYPFSAQFNSVGNPDATGNTKQNMRYKVHAALYNVMVDPRPVNITAGSLEKTYGDADPALTSIAPDTVYGDVIDYALTRDAGETVGEYAINVDVNPLDYPNYTVSSTAGVLKINPRELVLVGESGNVVYNGQEQYVTAYALRGLVGRDRIVSGISYRAAGTDAGSYDGAFTIDTATLKIENASGEDVTNCYTLQNEPGVLTITPEVAPPATGTDPQPPATPTEPAGPTPETDPVLEARTPTPEAPAQPVAETPAPAPATAPAATPAPAAPAATTPDAAPPAGTDTPPATPAVEDVPIENAPGSVEVLDGQTPLSNFGTGAGWSLLNLIMGLVSLLAAMALVVSAIARRRAQPQDTDEEEAEQPLRRRLMALRLPAILTGLLPAVLFLILENTRLPMTWITRWTPLIGACFVLNMAFVIAHAIVKKRARNEADTGEAGAN